MGNVKWNVVEIDWLTANFPHLSNAACAAYLQRTFHSIRRKADKMGLLKTKSRILASKFEIRLKRKPKYPFTGSTDYNRKYLQMRYQKLRREVLLQYSGGDLRCNCCGERYEKFLTIDHISAVGYRRNKITTNGIGLWGRLRKEGFPPGYQVLCYNCNCNKSDGERCDCGKSDNKAIERMPVVRSTISDS